LISFFDKIKEIFKCNPLDYLLRFRKLFPSKTRKIKIEENENYKKLKEIEKKLAHELSKNHLKKIILDYQNILEFEKTEDLNRCYQVFRSIYSVLFNFVSLMSIEIRNDPEISINFIKDIYYLDEFIQLDNSNIEVAIEIISKFEFTERSGYLINKNELKKIIISFYEIFQHFITSFYDNWIEIPRWRQLEIRSMRMNENLIRKELNTIKEILKEVKSVIKKDTKELSEDAVAFLKAFIKKNKISEDLDDFLDKFFSILDEENKEYLFNSIELRQNNLYYNNKDFSYKQSFQLLGIFLENLLEIIGKNHINMSIRNQFTKADKLMMGYMFKILYFDTDFSQILTKYANFDRKRPVEDFSSKIKELLILIEKNNTKNSNFYRYAISNLIRNFYLHVNKNSIFNSEKEMFEKVHDKMLETIFYVFKDNYGSLRIRKDDDLNDINFINIKKLCDEKNIEIELMRKIQNLFYKNNFMTIEDINLILNISKNKIKQICQILENIDFIEKTNNKINEKILVIQKQISNFDPIIKNSNLNSKTVRKIISLINKKNEINIKTLQYKFNLNKSKLKQIINLINIYNLNAISLREKYVVKEGWGLKKHNIKEYEFSKINQS